jgi:SAM-dependent methyltransferase
VQKNRRKNVSIAYDPRLEKSIQLLGDISTKRILNIGCKDAWLEKYIDSRKIPIQEMHSFDIIDYKFPKLNKRIHFTVDSVLTMKTCPHSYYDIVVFYEVIEHLPKNTELLALRNISRCLKPGGLLFLSTPHQSVISNILDPAYWLIGHRHYSVKRISHLLAKTQFSIKTLEIKGGIGESLGILLYYISKHILRQENLLRHAFAERRRKEYLDPKYHGFYNIMVVAQKRTRGKHVSI